MSSDSEMVWAFVFTFGAWSPPDEAFQPMLVDEASVSGDGAFIDSWIHVDWLQFLFCGKRLHLLTSDLEYSKSLLAAQCIWMVVK